MLSLRRTPFSSMTANFLAQPFLSWLAERTMGDRLNLSGGADRFVWRETTFGVHEVGCEDGVYQSGFPQSGLSCNCDQEMKHTTKIDGIAYPRRSH